jgi:sarcosine oxidase, subunit gamma
MSDPVSAPTNAPVSALNHARFEGLASIEDCGLQGMITLRGDLSNRTFKVGANKAGGVKMPARGMANVNGECGLCWMSPDELLVLCPYGDVQARLDALNDRLGVLFAMAVNVSDARAMLRVSGPASREVLAKLCPVDMSPSAFRPGHFRRTRLAQVPAAFWIDKDESIRIICFRSVAGYVFDLLGSAAQEGSDVGYFGTA